MPKLSPEDYLESLKSTKIEANKHKKGILMYERTASRHAKTLENWVTGSKKKIDDTVSELKTRFTKESQSFKSTAKSEAEMVESIRKDTKKQYNRFSQTYNAAMSKRNGVGTKHEKVLQLSQEVASNANDVSKNQTKVTNAKAAVDELLKTSRKDTKAIGSIHEEAEKVRQEIENTYAITLDTTMAGTLIERRNALKGRTKVWEILYMVSIGFIVAAIFVALLVSKPDKFVEVMTERLVFVTPLVLVAIIFGKHYNHERKLYEEYSFKAAAAQSLRGYTLLLNSEFKDLPEARLDILKFTVGAMEGIYDREPLVPNSSTMHLMFGNKWAKFETKLEEKVEKAVKNATKEATITKEEVTLKA